MTLNLGNHHLTITNAAWSALIDTNSMIHEEVMNMYFEMMATWANINVCAGRQRYLALPTRASLLLMSGFDYEYLAQGRTRNHIHNVSCTTLVVVPASKLHQ